MTHKQIFEALLAGKKLKSDCWNDENYVYLKDDMLYDEDNDKPSIDILDDTMLIFEEPCYQVLYWDNNYSRYAITNRKYRSEKAFKTYFYGGENRFIRFIKDKNS